MKQESALVTAKDWPYHSFENVWQFVCGLPQSVGGNVSVLFGHGGRIVADEFPRHGVRYACRFEQGGGRVPKRMKTDFVLFARSVAAFAGAVVAALSANPAATRIL